MRSSTTSKRLLSLIKELKISQRELSLKTGVSESVICRAIKHEACMTENNLVKIVDATGVSPEWILGYGADDKIEWIK